MQKGHLTAQYIGGIVADQLSKMAATIIGSTSLEKFPEELFKCVWKRQSCLIGRLQQQEQ